ncbi:MAG: SpoIIE family protein phosphatase [Phycisphaerae bacterium]|nr:SpoIIE family protein phosphatase [Phycisphaerae bacterium]
MIESHGQMSGVRHDLRESRAFQDASLRSEVRRACAVIAMIVVIIVVVFAREATRELDPRLQLGGLSGLIGLLAVQAGTLVFARWSERRRRSLPMWFVCTTVVAESLIPTVTTFYSVAGGVLPPYAALSAPPILAYGLLISLTTLRLRPVLCVIAGLVSAAGYAGVLAYVTYGLGIDEPTTGLKRAAYVNSSLLLAISGFAAAWVAREIRGHVAAALGEAETRRQVSRMEQDLAVARSIQRALLPRSVPSIQGFDIAGWNRPADQTGGDYYDWQVLPDGNWIVTLADVSGHGVGPAMVTAACRAYVRASSDRYAEFGTLTSRINRLLAEDLSDGRFVTMVSVLIDPVSGSLALLSAGHGPIALYISKTGQVCDIMPRDVPLAIVPDTCYGPAQTITLAPGDVLALITDGLVEWARPGGGGRHEQFGMNRLRDSLRRHAGRSAVEMIEAVAADVAAFARSEPQQDDLTMVVIRRVE